MADMDVTYQDMHDAGDHLTEEHTTLDEKLEELKNYIRDLTENGYVTSASSGAFNEAYEDFTNGAKQTLEGMTGMAQFLHDTADSLQEQDEERAAAIRGG
ncbi:WXG100 family type VII secretion target [Streptomyces sp. 4N509B]|uniref:WXG100 family type VII secretion target n=1 Tax=Streptomyces sp. 4N509B TaxID=3457413 RepID=UPI003FD664EA